MDGQKIIKRGNNLFNQLRSFLAAHSNIRLTKEMTFLDFGCGSGGMLHTLLQNGFDAFGVGLRGITDQDGQIIRAGEIDTARAGRLKRQSDP